MRKVQENLFVDAEGEYEKEPVVKNEIERQNFILEFKKKVSRNSKQLENEKVLISLITSKAYSEKEAHEIIKDTKEYIKNSELKFEFNWKQFWYELFDFERDLFSYFRVRPNSYYLEKDLLDKFGFQENKEDPECICPKCKSKNVKFAWAIDYKWDVLHLFLSFLLVSPFPTYRKKYHCFDCGHNFNKLIK